MTRSESAHGPPLAKFGSALVQIEPAAVWLHQFADLYAFWW